jgi:hypothetical protein
VGKCLDLTKSRRMARGSSWSSTTRNPSTHHAPAPVAARTGSPMRKVNPHPPSTQPRCAPCISTISFAMARPRLVPLAARSVMPDGISFHSCAARTTQILTCGQMPNRAKALILGFYSEMPHHRTDTPADVGLGPCLNCVTYVLSYSQMRAAGRSSGAARNLAQDEEHTICLYCVGRSSV